MNNKIVLIGIIAFVAGAIVATRLDPTAWAATVGAICAFPAGLVAGIAGTAYVFNRRHKRLDREREAQRFHQRMQEAREPRSNPPVVFVSPPAAALPPAYQTPWPGAGSEFDTRPIRRRFNVIGQNGQDAGELDDE